MHPLPHTLQLQLYSSRAAHERKHFANIRIRFVADTDRELPKPNSRTKVFPNMKRTRKNFILLLSCRALWKMCMKNNLRSLLNVCADFFSLSRRLNHEFDIGAHYLWIRNISSKLFISSSYCKLSHLKEISSWTSKIKFVCSSTIHYPDVCADHWGMSLSKNVWYRILLMD